ncbi:hypothetical protein B0H19DRAFT_1337461 [Mycena capillaripes]|nr:hypothetical protein B0H19DRAFT_1337461 [Mycena capillaripes]
MNTLKVNCTSTRCKFSPNHPSNCVPPACRRTCNQYHLFPEQYSTPSNLSSYFVLTLERPQD